MHRWRPTSAYSRWPLLRDYSEHNLQAELGIRAEVQNTSQYQITEGTLAIGIKCLTMAEVLEDALFSEAISNFYSKVKSLE